MVNPSIEEDQQLVYLCGLPSEVEHEFRNHLKLLSARYEVRVCTLNDVLNVVNQKSPTFLFLSIQHTRDLPEILSDMAFLRRSLPTLYRVLICRNELFMERALEEISCDGLLYSGYSSQNLLECLVKTSKGKRYIHHPVHPKPGNLFILDTLTKHERVILDLITRGLQNKQIAEQLCISPHTVKNHKSKLMTKLDLASTIDLYQFAVEKQKTFDLI